MRQKSRNVDSVVRITTNYSNYNVISTRQQLRNSAVLDKGPVKRDTSWSEVKVVIVGMCCNANDVAKVAVGGGADAALAALAATAV